MRLTSAWWSKKKNVGAIAQPFVTGTQGRNLRLGDHRHRVEVEVVERLAGQQFGFGEMALDTTPVTLGEFVFSHGGSPSTPTSSTN